MQLIKSIVLFAGLAAASPLGTVVERQPPPRATIVDIVVRDFGTGCPRGTFTKNIFKGALTANVNFLNYTGSIGPAFPRGLHEPTCRVDWIITFPVGCIALNFSNAFAGFLTPNVGVDVTATLNAPYAFTPTTGPGGALADLPPNPRTAILQADNVEEGRWQRVDKPDAVVTVANQNERNHTFSSDTSMLLQSRGGASGSVNLNSYQFSIGEQVPC